MRLTYALLFLTLASAPAAFAVTCDAALFADGVCDCGCGSTDPDCPSGTFKVCERSHCAAGKVPWEHAPESCMDSACGDGWMDRGSGEACDDGNAVSSGGCSAGCSAVNAGFTCGEHATGCQAAPVQQDAGTETRVPGVPGCASLPGAPLVVAVAAWATRRNRR